MAEIVPTDTATESVAVDAKPLVVVLDGMDKKVYLTISVVTIISVILGGIAIILLGRLFN